MSCLCDRLKSWSIAPSVSGQPSCMQAGLGVQLGISGRAHLTRLPLYIHYCRSTITLAETPLRFPRHGQVERESLSWSSRRSAIRSLKFAAAQPRKLVSVVLVLSMVSLGKCLQSCGRAPTFLLCTNDHAGDGALPAL